MARCPGCVQRARHYRRLHRNRGRAGVDDAQHAAAAEQAMGACVASISSLAPNLAPTSCATLTARHARLSAKLLPHSLRAVCTLHAARHTPHAAAPLRIAQLGSGLGARLLRPPLHGNTSTHDWHSAHSSVHSLHISAEHAPDLRPDRSPLGDVLCMRRCMCACAPTDLGRV